MYNATSLKIKLPPSNQRGRQVPSCVTISTKFEKGADIVGGNDSPCIGPRDAASSLQGAVKRRIRGTESLRISHLEDREECGGGCALRLVHVSFKQVYR